RTIAGYLVEGLKSEDLLHGVSFASAASGYDNLTARFTKSLSFEKLKGVKEAQKKLKNAVFVISADINDFLQNYFTRPQSRQQLSISRPSSPLCLFEMHKVGGGRFSVVGLPPLGCLAIFKACMNVRSGCITFYRILQRLLGRGGFELGKSCRGQKTCPDRSKYVPFDGVHLTEMMYDIIAKNIVSRDLAEHLA
ncbi:GDSL esterase/lipase At5g45950-like, partial [Amborella trichopoda]|uniref:GDSL esterase/lipase At5g45950-like n=1 Tax=Amborella trichopoda TaxID=13333 RepID=UPI0009BDF7EF